MSPSHCIHARLLILVAALAIGAATPGTAASDDRRRVVPIAPSEQTAEEPTKGERAVRNALDVVGVAYRWGGESPATGFDCSGLVRWAYGRIGIDLPHNSYALYGEGRKVPASSMKPGDILFFEGLGHVGLYVGGGRMVHSPETGRHVEVVRLAGSNYGLRLIGARRVAAR